LSLVVNFLIFQQPLSCNNPWTRSGLRCTP